MRAAGPRSVPGRRGRTRCRGGGIALGAPCVRPDRFPSAEERAAEAAALAAGSRRPAREAAAGAAAPSGTAGSGGRGWPETGARQRPRRARAALPPPREGPGCAGHGAAAGGAGSGAAAVRGPRRGRQHDREGAGVPGAVLGCTGGCSGVPDRLRSTCVRPSCGRGSGRSAGPPAPSSGSPSRCVPKESGRLASQIRRLYGANRRAARPFWLCLTEFAAGTPIYEQCFRMNDGFAGYLVRVWRVIGGELSPVLCILLKLVNCCCFPFLKAS